MGTVSSKRYSQAIFQIAVESDKINLWETDLALLCESIQDEDIRTYLDSPEIESSKKIGIINDSFNNSINSMAINLMSLLVTKNAVSDLPDMVIEFNKLVDERKGVEQAEIVSAVELDIDQETQILGLFQELVGKEVSISRRIDSNVLGGFVARVGDRLIDGSLSTRIKNMERDLLRGA
jgi:F-type H+-transporting ATPase subunit delta